MRKLALVLLAACGGSDNHHDVTIPDAAIDTPAPKQPVTVEFDVYGTPAFIAYRDGSGAWQTPTANDQGAYSLTVIDDYQVVVACTSASGDTQATQISATVDDAAQYAFCSSGTGDDTPPVNITGLMKQAGIVYMENTTESQTPNWTVSMAVSPRTHDLIAVDTQHRILMRRGLALTADTTLEPIDLTGAPTMTPLTLHVDNLGTDSLSANLNLMTANDYASFDSQTTQLWVPPASVLGSSDFQYLAAIAYSGNQYRWAGNDFTGTETSFTLPDPLTGVTFTGAAASWTTLPSYDQVELDLESGNGTYSTSQTVQATKRWIDAKHATSLAFDAQPPGYNPAWNVNAASYGGNFYALQSDAHGNSGAAIYHSNDARVAQRANRPWLSVVAKVRESMRSQHTMPRK